MSEYRQPPHSIEAEQALLGAILFDNRALERASDILEPQHFFDPLHRQIFEAMAKLITGNRLVTPTTIKPFFENSEPIREMPVAAYLSNLVLNATTIVNVPDYARTIRDLSVRRSLIDIGETMANAAYDSPIDFPPKEQIEEAEMRLFSLAERGAGDHGSASARQVLGERMAFIRAARENPGANCGVTMGLRDLDDHLDGGMQPSDLLVLAGATSMGKSALAGGVVMASPVPVALFTLEMSKDQKVDRMISAASGVPVGKLRSGKLSDIEWNRVVEAEQAINWRLGQRDIIIDDTPALSIAQLAARARRLKRRHGIGLLVVDYLQLLRGSRRDSRVLEIGEITSGLKAAAKEFAIPVLALAQLSREVDKRTGNRPHLSDLRESGSIEHDADVVMFVFREAYYVERDKPPVPAIGDRDAEATFKSWQLRLAACANKGEVIVAKARHGRIGTVDLHFDSTAVRFSNLARASQSHDQR